MTSSKDYVAYIMEQLAEAGDVRNRAMMGEYVVYYRDKVLGGSYDDRFLVKPVTEYQLREAVSRLLQKTTRRNEQREEDE